MSQRLTRGSLLVNLSIAFALILVIVTLSVPRISFMRRFLLRTEIEKLHSFFHFMQQKALSSNQDCIVTFNQEKQSYTDGNHQEVLPSGISFGFLPDAFGPPSKPNKQIVKAITFKNNQAVFYADGTIAAGTVYLVDKEHQQMYALTSPISQISFLRMYRYQKGSLDKGSFGKGPWVLLL